MMNDFMKDFFSNDTIICNQNCVRKGEAKIIPNKPYLIFLNNLKPFYNRFTDGYFIEDDKNFYQLHTTMKDKNVTQPISCLEELGNIAEIVCTPTTIEAFITSLLPPKENTQQNNTVSYHEILSHPNASGILKVLIKAFDKFWRNADLTDHETYPINKDVQAWIEKEFSHISVTKAKQIAEILRPETLPSGRRAEK